MLAEHILPGSLPGKSRPAVAPPGDSLWQDTCQTEIDGILSPRFPGPKFNFLYPQHSERAPKWKKCPQTGPEPLQSAILQFPPDLGWEGLKIEG